MFQDYWKGYEGTDNHRAQGYSRVVTWQAKCKNRLEETTIYNLQSFFPIYQSSGSKVQVPVVYIRLLLIGERN